MYANYLQPGLTIQVHYASEHSVELVGLSNEGYAEDSLEMLHAHGDP